MDTSTPLGENPRRDLLFGTSSGRPRPRLHVRRDLLRRSDLKPKAQRLGTARFPRGICWITPRHRVLETLVRLHSVVRPAQGRASAGTSRGFLSGDPILNPSPRPGYRQISVRDLLDLATPQGALCVSPPTQRTQGHAFALVSTGGFDAVFLQCWGLDETNTFPTTARTNPRQVVNPQGCTTHQISLMGDFQTQRLAR